MSHNPWKVVVLCLLIYNTVLSQQTIQYNLNVKDTFKVLQVVNQSIIQEIDNNKHTVQNRIESEYKFTIKKVTDSSYYIQCSFTHFKLKSTSNIYGELMNINTDSIPKEETMDSKLFSGLTKANLVIELLKTGEIKSLSGADALIEVMIVNANIEEEFTKAVIREAMSKEFGNEKLASSIEQMTFFYPTKKVKVGEVWSNEYFGQLSAINNWKLNATTPSISISGESDISFTSKEESNTMKLTGKQTSTIICNNKTGFMKTMTIDSKASGNLIVNQKDEIKIPTTIITKTSYKTL